jgi:hypothetical protein
MSANRRYFLIYYLIRAYVYFKIIFLKEKLQIIWSRELNFDNKMRHSIVCFSVRVPRRRKRYIIFISERIFVILFKRRLKFL